MRIFFLIALAIQLICSESEAQLAKQSEIRVTERAYDFGSIAQGTVVKHQFLLENKGTSDLKINRIIPSCGCTAGTIDPEVIEPGQIGKLSVEFDSTNFSGQQTKHLTLLTNDPLNDRVELVIKGTVETEIKIEPAQVVLPQVIKANDSLINASQIVKLITTKESTRKIKSIKTASDSIVIRELENSENTRSIEVAISPKVSLGEFRDSVTVFLGDANETSQSIVIPVYASIAGPLRLSQSVISFGLVDAKTNSAAIKRSVKLENFGKQPFQINSIDSRHPALTVNTVAIQKGQAYVVHVELDPNKLNKDMRTSVLINTSLEQQPLVLNVLAIIPPKL